jgi:hypothetical protein
MSTPEPPHTPAESFVENLDPHTIQPKAAAAQTKPRRKASGAPIQLSRVESFLAFIVFVIWLALFAAGIIVQTQPFRCKIDAEGVRALTGWVTPSDDQAKTDVKKSDPCPKTDPVNACEKVKAWVVVLLCFLPLNLAWVCATAGALGAFGNRANLSDDHTHRTSVDNTNPYTSAMLRGFFVYLFLISGLLLLDNSPFSHPDPGQYIRLAGFLSLSSFVVSYQPRLFSMLIVWAFHRIQVREGDDTNLDKAGTDTLRAKKTTITEVTATQPHTPSKDD